MHDDASNCGTESTGLHRRKSPKEKRKDFASKCVPQPKSADRMIAMAGFLFILESV